MSDTNQSWWRSQPAGIVLGAAVTFFAGTMPTAYFADRRAEQDRNAAERRWTAELQASDNKLLKERKYQALQAFATACQTSVYVSSGLLDDFEYVAGGQKT